MPFLTLEDRRAKVKGSRDPLGLVQLWYGPARQLIGNLTTATSSLRGFTLTLLGRWYAERLVQEERATEADALSVFLRVEQIGAYTRYVMHDVDDDTRGIERVKRHVAEGSSYTPIGTGRDALILSDQKVYGLWGLYSVATRMSGLLCDGPFGLTPAARDAAESMYGQSLRSLDPTLLGLVQNGGRLNVRRNGKLMTGLGQALPDPITRDEAAWYAEWIRDGLHVASLPPGRQRDVMRLLREHTDLAGRLVRSDLERMRDHAADDALRHALQDVLDLEALLVPADFAFEFIRSQAGRRPGEVAQLLQDQWGTVLPHFEPKRLRALLLRITAHDDGPLFPTIDRTLEAFSRGNYAEAVHGLLAWNECVMRARGSAPWVSLDPSGRIDVHFAGVDRVLPTGEELEKAWQNSYFLGSAKQICRAIEAAR